MRKLVKHEVITDLHRTLIYAAVDDPEAIAAPSIHSEGRHGQEVPVCSLASVCEESLLSSAA